MHIPVLSDEVIRYLDPKPNEHFIDCTVGEAGHALEILKRTSPAGKILGIDLNGETLTIAEQKLKAAGFSENRFQLIQDNFINLQRIVDQRQFGSAQGILFDLGISSEELEHSGRGFSFLKDEPLLMTFRETQDGLTAQKIINEWPENRLEEIFRTYGEERFAARIARNIVEERKRKKIMRTQELVSIIKRSFPGKYRYGNIHVATRIFQALRITVNHELDNLKSALDQALDVLAPGGRMVFISFHSLEDRIVKHFLRHQQKNNTVELLTKKPVRPEEDEVKCNPRSRSAKLRAAVKKT